MKRRSRRRGQQSFEFRTRGGRRRGAGRKRRTARRRVSHARRAVLRPGQPVHVTLRLRAEVGSVRCRRGFALVRQVMQHVAGRYHDEVLATPTQVRRCIGYVLCNWRKHGFAVGAATVLDPYSTARHFTGWAEQARLAPMPRTEEDTLPCVPPRSWLLREGWRRGGAAPSVFEVPSVRVG